MNDREYAALTDVIERAKKVYGTNEMFAETYCKGKALILDESLVDGKKKAYKNIDEQLEDSVWSYIIQEKLGDTMENFLFEKDEPFSEKTVLQIGI